MRKFINVMVFLAVLFSVALVVFIPTTAKSQRNQNVCKVFYDKSVELAEKGAEDLPERQTLNFDPRIAKSKASLAYSQIYRNCKEYGE